MGLDKKAMFEKLLEQIKWQDDREVFSDALIEKVEVHTKSKRWDFYLETNDILPFQTFAKLNQLVETSFRPICKTRLHFTTRNPVINDEKLVSYWAYAVETSGKANGFTQNLLQNSPELDHGEVKLLAENTVLRDFLKRNVLERIEASYQDASFPRFTI